MLVCLIEFQKEDFDIGGPTKIKLLGCHTKLGRRCKSRTKSGAELLSSLSQLKFGLFNISFLRAINSSSVFGRSTSRIVARESIAEFMPFQGECRAKASE